MKRSRRRVPLWILLAAVFGPVAAAAPADDPVAPASAASCAPQGGLEFVCGLSRPEDLIVLPGDRWLVASGYADHSGLHVIDALGKTAQQLRWPAGGAADPRWGACAAPPDPDRLQAHGLALGRARGAPLQLFVVNHGTRESVEVFDVAIGDAGPTLTWRGCIAAPSGQPLNSLVANADGSLLATVSTLHGHAFYEAFEGRRTGAVFEWRSAAAGFREVAGTRLAGNNGIETSPDGRTVYVLAAPARSMTAFRRGTTWRRLWTLPLPELYPDNLHWGGDGRLYVAGMAADEPACGGPVKVIDRAVDLAGCLRSYRVLTIDPASRSSKTVARGSPADGFRGAASAIPAGGSLWIGSWWEHRVAYRPWPR